MLTGKAAAPNYAVPAGSVLIVTDVLTAGTVEVSSDDGATDAVIDGTQHFTAGLLFATGSHVNIKGLSGSGLMVQLFGYLAKASQ